MNYQIVGKFPSKLYQNRIASLSGFRIRIRPDPVFLPGSGSGIGFQISLDSDPDPVCSERLDSDHPVCPERLDPDPVIIRPDPKLYTNRSQFYSLLDFPFFHPFLSLLPEEAVALKNHATSWHASNCG